MRACVRLDDGRASEWFKVCQGVRQGCVIVYLLFMFFFTAVLNTAEMVMEDPLVVKDLVSIATNAACEEGRERAQEDPLVVEYAVRQRRGNRLAIEG